MQRSDEHESFRCAWVHEAYARTVKVGSESPVNYITHATCITDWQIPPTVTYLLVTTRKKSLTLCHEATPPRNHPLEPIVINIIRATCILLCVCGIDSSNCPLQRIIIIIIDGEIHQQRDRRRRSQRHKCSVSAGKVFFVLYQQCLGAEPWTSLWWVESSRVHLWSTRGMIDSARFWYLKDHFKTKKGRPTQTRETRHGNSRTELFDFRCQGQMAIGHVLIDSFKTNEKAHRSSTWYQPRGFPIAMSTIMPTILPTFTHQCSKRGSAICG